jgi:hypothetical protein
MPCKARVQFPAGNKSAEIARPTHFLPPVFATISIGLLSLMKCAYATEVSDPQGGVINRRYEIGDVIKLMTFDINGDGVADLFFTTIASTPDPTTATSNEQLGGSLSWDVYVSKQSGGNFTINGGLEIGGEITQGAGLQLNPDQMYVGDTSEIGRFAIVTSAVERSKSENSTIIYAYTWEGDRFKQWKLAQYTAGEQNAVFDKYLKDDKRTPVNLKQIKP